jgi:hypothetical protein
MGKEQIFSNSHIYPDSIGMPSGEVNTTDSGIAGIEDPQTNCSEQYKGKKIERHVGHGHRPKEIPGLLRVSKRCKICQSPHISEITEALLNGMTYSKIVEKWGSTFTPPLNIVNIHSHKQHCNPSRVAKIDATQREFSLVGLEPSVVALYQQKYDETLNKIKTVNLLYDARLRNLWELLATKKNLEKIPASERSSLDNKTLKELTVSIDEIMKGLTKNLLDHVKIDQGPGVVNVNVMMIQTFKSGIEKFIEDFVDVLVQEISDPLVRDRIKERFVEKLDERISPMLDPTKMITVDAKIVDNEEDE